MQCPKPGGEVDPPALPPGISITSIFSWQHLGRALRAACGARLSAEQAVLAGKQSSGSASGDGEGLINQVPGSRMTGMLH